MLLIWSQVISFNNIKKDQKKRFELLYQSLKKENLAIKPIWNYPFFDKFAFINKFKRELFLLPSFWPQTDDRLF